MHRIIVTHTCVYFLIKFYLRVASVFSHSELPVDALMVDVFHSWSAYLLYFTLCYCNVVFYFTEGSKRKTLCCLVIVEILN